MLKLIQYYYMILKKNNYILVIAIIIFFFFISLSCGPSERSLEYRNSQISGIVDSTIYFKMSDSKKHFLLVQNKWYVVPASFYGYFINYVDKGDSIYKELGRWDIYVYKKKNGKYIEKYFICAQDNWD